MGQKTWSFQAKSKGPEEPQQSPEQKNQGHQAVAIKWLAIAVVILAGLVAFLIGGSALVTLLLRLSGAL